MNEELDDVLNVVQRWESLGLLEGLPLQERVELAQIYDNATRLMLSELSLKRIPKKVSEILDETYIPICRRLYRRVGPNFDLENMMGELLESVNKTKFEKSDEPNKNPIIDFCINFADNYEDSETSKNLLSEEEYKDKINLLLVKLKEILLNDKMVSYVDKTEDDYVLNIGKQEKTKQQTRFWNQSVAKNLFNSFLSEINKGL